MRLRGFLGRHLSVRIKLTIWYGSMCAVTLGAVGIVMNRALDYRVTTSTDSSLQETARSLLPALARPIGVSQPTVSTCAVQGLVEARLAEYCTQVQRELNQNQRASAPGQFERVFVDRFTSPDQTFFVVPVSPDVPIKQTDRYQIQTDASLLRRVLQGESVYLDTSLKGIPYRVLAVPMAVPDELRLHGHGAVGALEVYQNQKNIRYIQDSFNSILLLGLPLGVFVALLAGWWIARAALRPINRISRTVRTIGSSRDLSRRLNFVGPSDEVGQLAETFDEMMSRLEGAFETQKRFVADASHELRTPLTAIRGNADLISIAPPEEREQCIASIRREAERMSRLVTDMLLLAEADAQQQSVHKVTVHLDELLTEVCRSAVVLATGKVDVRFQSPGPLSIQGDPDRLKQLFLNLVDNAIKFTPEGGWIRLEIEIASKNVIVRVIDNGVGIPRHERDAIFRRFYRVEESRTHRGSGLGLAICAWVVASHDGKIDVESTPGKGTIFSVTLPRGNSAETPGRSGARVSAS